MIAAREKHQPWTIKREPDLFTVDTSLEVDVSVAELTHSDGSCAAARRALSNVGGPVGRHRQGISRRFMRFTSLVVELIRARPRLVVWIVVLLQAALWLFVPLLFYSQPARRPRDRARLWPGISGRHRSRPAAGVLARRHRLSCRGQSPDRRLFPVAALFGRRRSGSCICWRAPSSAASRRCWPCCSP